MVVLLALMLVPTVRSWFEQRQELTELRAKVTQQEQTVQALQEEKARWADPAYVEQQARQRLKFVKPGEVAFTVIGADRLADTREGQVRGQMVAPANDDQMSWYTQLWTSVELTDGIGRGTTRLDGNSNPTPTEAPTTTPTQTPSAPQSVPGAGGDQPAPRQSASRPASTASAPGTGR
ncbi:MAG: septum formation initiator family protein [Austwickia sp.]|nr:MAG: septum formation initiator family protein [Austwickia sp.]